jgi:hypothetical protein
LKPNLDYKIDVDEGAIPGIVGVQHITTDEKGFRVTPPVDYTEKSGLRIFTIGGSTTVDIYLDDRATWTHHLQENLKAGLDRPVEAITTQARRVCAPSTISRHSGRCRYTSPMS